MRDADRQSFAALLTGTLVEIYQRPALSAEAMEVWWNSLAAYEFASVREAFGRHLLNPDQGQFPPKPADIVRHLEGSAQSRAQQAWAKVHQAMGRVGQYQSVVFDDPVIHAVITAMGGWPVLCSVTTDELPFRSREFEQRYGGYLLRGRPEYLRCLAGLSETQNSANGFAVSPPVMVGDPDKAMQVFLGGQKFMQFTRPLPLKLLAEAAA